MRTFPIIFSRSRQNIFDWSNNISKTKLFSFVKSYFKDLLAYLNEYREYASRKETEVFSEMMEYYNTYFKGKRLIKK